MSNYSVFSVTTVTHPLSAGSITMSSSFCSRLSTLCSSLVKLLSSFGVDCIVEATLLRMLCFIDAIKTVQIPNNHRLVSFDVKSLFTSILLQLALECTWTLLQQTVDDTPLPLPNDKIMDLLKLCLESTFSQYNRRHYKQLHDTAMGSPVSVVVAEIVMQHIEKRALATYDQTLHFGSATSTIL